MSLFICTDHAALSSWNTFDISDQMMMEILLTASDTDYNRTAFGGDASDACTWQAVECDASRDVCSIDWDVRRIAIRGSVDFHMLPGKLRKFSIITQDCHGEMRTDALPPNLEAFSARECHFTGTADLRNLPGSLQVVFIAQNRITAVENLVNLPASLHFLKIDECELLDTNSLWVGKIPQGSRLHLDVIGCGFENLALEDPNDHACARLCYRNDDGDDSESDGHDSESS